jgi:phage recombination protein Bet
MEAPKILNRLAERYCVDADKLFTTLKATAFRQRDGTAPSNEQMMALLVVAEQYGLNPFTKEIYAFPDKQSGIIPVVGVDGWSRMINQHPHFDGMEFFVADRFVAHPGAKDCPEWLECVIYRTDRQHSVRVKEYLDEVYRPPFEGMGSRGPYQIAGPWQTHTKRMLRHKAMIQCARLAFGLVGIFDQDEAERIIEGESQPISDTPPPLPDAVVSDPQRTQVQRLVDRARSSGAWNNAFDYATEHFEGAVLQFARQSLADAQQQAMSDDDTQAMAS